MDKYNQLYVNSLFSGVVYDLLGLVALSAEVEEDPDLLCVEVDFAKVRRRPV